MLCRALIDQAVIFLHQNSFMIQELLSETELSIQHQLSMVNRDLNAVQRIKNLVDQVDHDAEVIPLENKERFVRLLVSLKGKVLDEEEYRIVGKIFE